VAEKSEYLRCDGFGCNERHPLDHDCLGEPCFGTGRWLGWVYLDLNRPDLFPRELRFCGTQCLRDWLEREIQNRFDRIPVRTALDDALRAPHDEIARKRAGLGLK
jgi:hypothetical protein